MNWTDIELDKEDQIMATADSNEALTPTIRKKGFWSKRTGLEKALLAVVGVCGMAMVAGGSYYAINLNNTNANVNTDEPIVKAAEFHASKVVKQEEEFCTTPECTLAASRILSSLDQTANPCDNFFQFACGQWIVDNPIPDSESRWGTFDVLDSEVQRAVRKAIEAPISEDDPNAVVSLKNMYTACNDLETIEAAGYAEYLNFTLGVMGGWPMIQNFADAEDFSWETFTGLARRFLNHGLILTTYVFMDSFDVSQNIIHIDQASLALPRDFYLDEETYADYIAAYKNYIAEVALVLTREAGQFVTEDSIRQSAEEVYTFEKILAIFSVPDEDRRNTTEMYNPMTVAELTEKYPFNWADYFNHMFGATDVEIDETERVIVIEPEYLRSLLAVMNAFPKRVTANYLFWRNVMAVTSLGPQELGEIAFKFSSVLTGVTQKPSRSASCTNLVSNDGNGFGFAVAHEYIKKNFDEDAKAEANELVNNLRIAFKELVDESLWMDEDTQEKAKEKADLMLQLLGYPEYVRDPELLDQFYEAVRPAEVDTHFMNVVGVKSFAAFKELETLRMPPDREFWFYNPATVNAWYSPNHNSITFPAAILHPPFFRKGNPRYLNYGAIGVVIGHEITHGFDDQGRQYDGTGNAFPWWSQSTIEAFQTQADCFVEMYENYTVPELVDVLGEDAHLDGFNTQGENIADNGGLRESFRAYKKSVEQSGPELKLPGLSQYTPEQLFFVGYAQVWCESMTDSALLNQVLTNPHSPAKYRVIGPLSNSEDFIENFQCGPETPMNREEKCLLW